MLYIFNSNEELLTILSNHSDESPAYWNDIHHEKLSGENTFSFTVPADNEAAQYITEGNFVAWQDLDEHWQMFEIMHKVDTHGEGLITDVECEHVVYELLDEFLPWFTSGTTTSGDTITPTKISIDEALGTLLSGTRWDVGTISVGGTHSFDYEYDNVYSLLQKVAAQWQGELQYTLVITNGVIVSRLVSIYAKRGQDRGKQFVYGKDIKSIERDIDLSGVCTALYGRGKDTLSVYVTDADALVLWGRAGGTRHRKGMYENTEQADEDELRAETEADLQLRNSPQITYTLKATTLETIPGYEDEKTRIGDTVRCIDRTFNPPLLVSTRVVEITRSLSSPEDTEVVLGTYKPTIIEDLAKQKKQVSDAVSSVASVKTVTDDVKNGDLTAEIIKIGVTNGSGTSQIDTRGDGLRIQPHPSGTYTKFEDNGGLSFYVGDVCYGRIFPDGTTDLNGGGGTQAPFTTLGINFAADGTGFQLTRDGAVETWTWTKDDIGRITEMTTPTARSVAITYP